MDILIDEGCRPMTEEKVEYENREEARIAYKPLYESKAEYCEKLQAEVRELTRDVCVWQERCAMHQELIAAQKQLIACLLKEVAHG